MRKLSAALAAGGLALLLWSFLPASSTSTTSTTSTPRTATAAMGRALFTAKGCAMCHTHRRAVSSAADCCTSVGPDLTDYTNDPAFLQRWLANPRAVKPGTQMPDLNLSETEIEDLIAFLNEPR